MKSILIFSIAFSLISCNSHVVPQSSINVSSEFYQGKELILQGGFSSEYNEFNDFNFVDSSDVILESAKILVLTKSKTKVNVELSYPHPFQFAYIDTATQQGSSSTYFFLGEEDVNVNVKELLKDKTLLSGAPTRINLEYQNLQNLYSKYVDIKTGEITDLKGKLSVMQQYISKNPNSYVALWGLVPDYYALKTEANRRKILGILEGLSGELKSTKTFQAYVQKLQQDLVLVKNTIMPDLLINDHGSILNIAAKNNFTLIDFWFSSCVPCIGQFPELKKVYAGNKSKGFEIIGIAVDGHEQITKWREIISKNELEWIQHLDTAGVEAEKLYIRKYPTNFLLDKAGKIVLVDILPEELEAFLKRELG